MRWNKDQKISMADFLNNLAIVIITLGVIQPLFNQDLPLTSFLIHFTFSATISILLIIRSLKLLEK